MSFWDTSSLVPLCVNEDSSAAARRLWNRLRIRHVWCETIVELESALARLSREGHFKDQVRRNAERRLVSLEQNWQIVSFETRVVDLARAFPGIYGLKAPDSLQLAAALIWCKEFPKNKGFVTGDARLSKAAESTGFTIHYLS